MRFRFLTFLLAPFALGATDSTPLKRTLSAGGRTEVSEVPRIALAVPRGGAVSPKLPAGGFEARWEGRIVAPKRGDYVFTVKVRGALKVTINGRLEIEGAGTGMSHPMDKTLLLEAGANSLVAEFSSDGVEDAVLELDWKPR